MSEPILFLAHRLPFPPNKGDKVRSYHLLKHVAQRYRVFLGAFIDDPADRRHIEGVRGFCADSFVAEIHPRRARLRSVLGLLTGEALTLPYYRNAALERWVRRIVREQGIKQALVFSSAMAPYAMNLADLDCVVDFVDVDSDKWRQYGNSRQGPLSWIYRREADRLLRFEREVALWARASLLVTEAEAELFRGLAPESAAKVFALNNGVDTDFFRPLPEVASPFGTDDVPIVFTGAMDYWPNIDAVSWFVREVLPGIRAHQPRARFYVVGMNPTPAVRTLAETEGVTVTGRVPDVRPYLQHARVVVAPLRVARGIQNKVLEAMAMARPVVVSALCAGPLAAVPGKEIEIAADAVAFRARTLALLDAARAQDLGAAARARVLASFNWETNLRRLDELMGERIPDNAAGHASGPKTGACSLGAAVGAI